MDIAHLRAALSRNQPRATGLAGADAATVALLLAGPEPAVCLIRRATRERDAWSGHLALPGGRAGADDRSPTDTAEREVLEEIGLRLDERHRIGALPDLRVRLADSARDLFLSSVVYVLDHPPALITGDEAVEALWVSFEQLWDPANATCFVTHDGSDILQYPAIRCHGHTIWGITLRVLILFSDIVGRPLPHFEEIPGMRRAAPAR